MFVGSVCQQVREWFSSNTDLFEDKVVLSGCCGNFTIETVLSAWKNPPSKIISNDVSLYSSALGAYFTDYDLGVVEPIKSEWNWLKDYMVDEISTAAMMIVLLDMAPFLSVKTIYHIRMMTAYIDGFGNLHKKAVERLKARSEQLNVAEYIAGDVTEFWKQRACEGIFLSFMPTYSGGYEKMYKAIDDLLEWKNKPKYPVMNDESKQALLDSVVELGNYVHIDDMVRNGMNVVAVIEGGHNRPVYIHSDLEGADIEVYHRSKMIRSPFSTPLLGVDDEICGEKIELQTLTNQQFAWVRDQYLQKKIIPADPSYRYAVVVDGKVIGLLGWTRGHDGESYYLMCDLALPSHKYKRLSKLVLNIANSVEMLKVLRQQSGRMWEVFYTTAFTDKPVSMKYRGVLELAGRNKKEAKLNYVGMFDKSMKKAVGKWQKLEKAALKQK